MATTHGWNHLEQNTNQVQLDQTQDDMALQWEDFSQFYKTANDWDYPVEDRKSLKMAEQGHINGLINHDDMFKNHGSRHSMDILADELGTKWAYNLDKDTTDTDRLLPKENALFVPSVPSLSTCLSTTAQATSSPRIRNLSTGSGEEEVTITSHKNSITDSQGIDVSDDTQKEVHEMDKDRQIKELRIYIQQIENEKKELIEENQRLKLRNSELRKTLNKAQQYRRKSSIAVHNLMNINDKISNLQQEKENIIHDGKNEEKVREEEELNNLKIQEQIQQAIAMFQEEFGTELDEELNNIESFQYESLADDSTSDDEPSFDNLNTDTTQNEDTITDKEDKEDKPFRFGALGVDFRIKFTDANSNGDGDDNIDKNKEYRFVDDDDDNDALPDSFTTPGGPNDYVTPGGPGMDDVNVEQDNTDKLEQMEARLNSLGDRILTLMERIEVLTDTNQQLELSKMELIANTSDAMNEYRDTIKQLSQQNELLLIRIKAT